MGKWVSIDKQPIGFKGACELELCISDKSEGGDYQCDAICEELYNYSFFFFSQRPS
jgi:hypothetical protein